MILFPVARGGDVIRHQDPVTLKDENPYWLNLYMFYDLAYGSLVAERFGDIAGWLRYAEEVYATKNLAESLTDFSGLIGNVSTELNATRSQIEVARRYLRLLNLSGASSALDQAMSSLRSANSTVARLDVRVKLIASNLKASADPLLEDNQKLRELIAKYLKMIDDLRSDIRFYKITNGEPVSRDDWDQFFKDHPELNPADYETQVIKTKQTQLLLTVDPDTVIIGETVKFLGLLRDASGQRLPSKAVSIYFDDELVSSVVTLSDGSFSGSLKVPYLYKDRLVVRAEFHPSSQDLYSYLPSFAEVVISLIYYTPTLEVSVPDFVYPGTVAEFLGYLSYDREPIQGVSILVIGLGGSKAAVTGAGGRFRETISVRDDYPAGSALVVVRAEPRDVYGPVDRVVGVNVVRVKSSVSVNSDSWVLSGSNISVKGVVLADGESLGGCRVVVRGVSGEFTTETRVDGSYEISCGIPVSVFTGNAAFNVYAFPAEPWIDSSSVESKVLVVNVYSIFIGAILVGYGVYSLSKRVKPKPKKRLVVAPTVEVASLEASVDVEPVEDKPQYPLKNIIFRALDFIFGLTGLEFKPNATIREYLSLVRSRVSQDAFESFSKLMLAYERWLYGRPAGQRKDFLVQILDAFNGLFGK
jgi:hypothetical protein